MAAGTCQPGDRLVDPSLGELQDHDAQDQSGDRVAEPDQTGRSQEREGKFGLCSDAV